MVSVGSTKVVQIFGYFQDKRLKKALEHLACAYQSNLDTEAAILEALIQIGDGTDEEEAYCIFLRARADDIKQEGLIIRQVMRDIANGVTYEDCFGSSGG
jgi:hypothetical protein